MRYSPRDCKVSETTERLSLSLFIVKVQGKQDGWRKL